ncbi:hypothetical protein Dsin_018883 [Dipteronia sinensis]|uniref:Uncharacterized protein n=1 Tax=Dipteronia sinensis TaxID=43782 RepID=A0AAE0E1Z6_9ROSI|nr:hypothetical protein Dsin_018883 [Dipteronia sinensis]
MKVSVNNLLFISNAKTKSNAFANPRRSITSALSSHVLNTSFVLQYSDSSDEDSTGYNSSPTYSSYQAVSTEFASGPQVPIQILLEKFSKPIDVIAYFDTGSHTTMMNPNILPPDSWKPHT